MPFLYFTTAWFSSPILRGSYRSYITRAKSNQRFKFSSPILRGSYRSEHYLQTKNQNSGSRPLFFGVVIDQYKRKLMKS
ncbi:hypothetical protein BN1326_150271 [Staphylococcus argenteus]|uniref:Uncharacterized protein n=1 Tax=Staphylococcus argenteus TaxID=985002 RepID=A0A249Y6H2_9STAP|nr:hypothetical protein [Staphylococcus argenteus]AXH79942.1 hypothetical protein [Staphylococcus argenteus]AXH79949.1 hypothetical protein [Staphylococcus argenteus]AXH79955.1 hypothetical protein [Staphylococcus argenteus]AXH79962.1 hypothetical protein [Staphylococcus argenteus]